jgi:hypothetical protein
MRAAAFLLLLSLSVHADDAPRAVLVAPGHVVTEPSWLFTREGKANVDAELGRLYRIEASAQATEAALTKSLREMESKPALTAKGVLLLGGVGFVVGVAATTFVVIAVKR